MILLVNGGLFLFMAVSTWGLSGFTDQCQEDVQGDCDPSTGVSGAMRNVAAGLVIVGSILLVLGVAIRRPERPPQP